MGHPNSFVVNALGSICPGCGKPVGNGKQVRRHYSAQHQLAEISGVRYYIENGVLTVEVERGIFTDFWEWKLVDGKKDDKGKPLYNWALVETESDTPTYNPAEVKAA